MLFLSGLCGYAQQSVLTSGGTAVGSGGAVSYSVGQPVYITYSGSTGSVAAGVQQAFEVSVVSINETITPLVSVEVFPNPVVNALTLAIQDASDGAFSYQLTDLQGRIIEKKNIEEASSQVDMSSRASAVYLLNIFQQNKLVKAFRVVKNN